MIKRQMFGRAGLPLLRNESCSPPRTATRTVTITKTVALAMDRSWLYRSAIRKSAPSRIRTCAHGSGGRRGDLAYLCRWLGGYVWAAPS